MENSLPEVTGEDLGANETTQYDIIILDTYFSKPIESTTLQKNKLGSND
jgi:hypothetical protein